MIVVVIIGILAAVAIPSYQGFQDRAKATEAKVQLSAIYSAEKAYFSENNGYSIDLEAIGASGTEVGQYYKAIGFHGTNANNSVGGSVTKVHAKCVATASGTGAGGTAATDPAKNLGFQACAQREAGDDKYDAKTDWNINNKKILAKSAPL